MTPLAYARCMLAAPASPSPGSAAEWAPFVVLAVLAVVAVCAILVGRARRRRLVAARPSESASDASDPGALWGLHVPGTPVQRMAKSLAIGFISIDPEETSQLVRSTDGGATWHVVPRERWGDASEGN